MPKNTHEDSENTVINDNPPFTKTQKKLIVIHTIKVSAAMVSMGLVAGAAIVVLLATSKQNEDQN